VVRIVSGSPQQYEDPGLAFLAGHAQGTERAKEARANEAERLRLGLQIQHSMAEYKREQAKAMADINARVQMGDVQALKQQQMAAMAAGLPPEQKMLQEYVQLRGRTKDPKAQAMLDEDFKSLSDSIAKDKQKRAALDVIDRAGKNGTIDPEEYKMRMDSGESPENITQEIGKITQAKNIETLAFKKNGELIGQAQALIDAFPPGQERLTAESLLNEYQNDAAGHSEPGSAAHMLQNVQAALLAGQRHLDAQAKVEHKEMEQRYGSQRKQRQERAKLLGDMDEDDAKRAREGAQEHAQQKFKIGGKAMEKHVASQKAEKEKRYPGSTSSSAQAQPLPKPKGEVIYRTVATLAEDIEDEADLARKMKEQGIPLTAANQAVAKKALLDRRNRAHQAGAADR